MAPITVLSVNVAELKIIPGSKKKAKTGIYKEPVERPVQVRFAGLVGDHIGSTKYHGGPDQAVYLYALDDYQWWEESLEQPLPFGTFGENLSVTTLGPNPTRVGDIWRLPNLVLQITAPRIPCATLAARMGDPKFVKKFAQANRCGAYARVLHEGSVKVGDSVSVQPAEERTPTIAELFELCHARQKDPELLRRALQSPLASLMRKDMEKWLSRISER